MVNSIKINISIFILFSLIISCKNDKEDTDIIYQQLKNREVKALIKINGSEFYSQKTTFLGDIFVNNDGLKFSISSPDKGNVIISMEGSEWYKNRPYKVVFEDGYSKSSLSGSCLIGKLIAADKGDGYILYKGTYEITALNEAICVVLIDGFLKKPFGGEELYPVKGKVIFKNPTINVSGSITSDAFKVAYQK